ncbi:diguanylate cyclase domain-containing protein [Psychrobacillus sp. NPDC058041]
MLLDINSFKAINDTYGYYFDDQILQDFTTRIPLA